MIFDIKGSQALPDKQATSQAEPDLLSSPSNHKKCNGTNTQ